MTDAISRSAAIKMIDEMDISDCTDVEDIIDKACGLIKQLPALDAVPVVRCKDCKHHDAGLWCAELERGTSKDFFCAYGERKER